MKRILLLTFLLFFANVVSGAAWVSVPDRGDTGWRTYIYHVGPAGFNGTAGFVVSNVIDNSAYSELLLDNLSQGGGVANGSFESGNYSGYSLLETSSAEVTTSVTSYLGNVYNPTQGDYFSHQLGLGTGIATSAFRNARSQTGTSGSILETAVSLPPGSSFTFNWAFLAGDSSPWNDFALFYLKDNQGNIVFSDGLAQIGSTPTPLPPAIMLFGLGLLCLWGCQGRVGPPRQGDQ